MTTQNIYDMSDTWNNGATTFTSIKMNATDSASAADSKLMNLLVNNSSKYQVDKDGDVVSAGTVNGMLSVFSYGATGDARTVADGTTINGTNTVGSVTAAFTSADVGKILWGIEPGSPGFVRVDVRTITAVNSATTVTVNGSAFGASYTSLSMTIGTDDTTALQTACTAAKALGRAIYLPGGGYIIGEVPFDLSGSAAALIPIIGEGSANTVFWPRPDIDFGGVTDSLLVEYGATSNFPRFRGFQVNGNDIPFSASGHNVLIVSGAKGVTRDVKISQCQGFTNGLFASSTNGNYYDCWVEEASYIGIACNVSSHFVNCYTGNNTYGFAAFGGIDPSDQNGFITWMGGMIDECPSGSAQIDNVKGVYFIGTRIWSFANGTGDAINVTTSGSEVHIIGCQVGPYNDAGNIGGLNVAAGCTARITHSRFYKSGSGKAITNAGTIYDGGGNTYVWADCTGTRPRFDFSQLPTSDPSISGAMWNNAGTVKIST